MTAAKAQVHFRLAGEDLTRLVRSVFEDGATHTEAGVALDNLSLLRRLRTTEQDLHGLLQLQAGHVEYMGSPEGLVAVPRCRVRAIQEGKEGVLDGLYKLVSSPGEKERALNSPAAERERFELGLSEEAPPPPRPPPQGTKVIPGEPGRTNGWLSPEGVFYACPWMGHNDLADALGYTAGVLENRGWVKLCEDISYPILCDVPLTEEQKDRVYAWSGVYPE